MWISFKLLELCTGDHSVALVYKCCTDVLHELDDNYMSRSDCTMPYGLVLVSPATTSTLAYPLPTLVQYSSAKDGSALGVAVTINAMLTHPPPPNTACHYTEVVYTVTY